MRQEELVALARQIATSTGIDDALFCAVVEQESAWNTWAISFEPGFYEHYVKPLPDLTPTEAYARSFSWGLCQVMGQVAREHGFEGVLSTLCDPQSGLTIGAKVLHYKLNMANGDVEKGLLRWNGGGNPMYPGQVLARKPRYEQTNHDDVQAAAMGEN